MTMKKHIFRWSLIAAGIAVGVFFVWVFFREPSHNRDWEKGQEKLPRFLLERGMITVENVRDFYWTGPFEAEPRYSTQTYRLSQLESLDVVISHFDEFEGLAHIFLRFRFSDGNNLNISLETRREKDEEFSPWLGLINQYEIIYVAGTDNDLIGVRVGPREERVYRYATVATSQQAKMLFLLLVQDINAVYDHPIFYNTFTDNCVNRLTRRVEEMSSVEFPFTYKSIFPGYFDEVLYALRLISNEKSFAETKNAARIYSVTEANTSS